VRSIEDSVAKTYAGFSTDRHGIGIRQRTRGFRVLYYRITYYRSRILGIKVARIGSIDTTATKKCCVPRNVRIAQLKVSVVTYLSFT
jgi:hypothetical protein